MKRNVPVAITILCLLAGLGVLLYPSFSKWLNARNQSQAIQNYTEHVEQLDAADLREMWEEAKRYNQAFTSSLADPEGAEAPLEYTRTLNLGTGVMGYVEIPVINVYLPIRHGTAEEVLKRGAGHVPETALPIGGEGIHPVITGHRAMATADLFNDLGALVEGDQFLLHILDETLCYQVDQITVVEPQDIQSLLPVAGEDYVTLVTCTPYAINSHRLLVRGHRIPYEADAPIEVREVPRDLGNNKDWQALVILAFAILWAVLLIWLRLSGKKKNRKKGKRKSRVVLAVIVLLLLAGAGTIAYPFVSNWLFDRRAEQIIEDFNGSRRVVEATVEEYMDEVLRRIHQYNRWLFEAGQEEGLQDPFAFERTNSELVALGYTEELFGYITIEKMGICLPVYLGGSQENLNRGAAHMTCTSIPVGGRNTNACIIGHRNLARAEMLRNIDLLEEGDVVVFSNFWEDLTYVVTETKVIWPHESEQLLIREGLDMLTLVSCYPKGSDIQRILVFCERE